MNNEIFNVYLDDILPNRFQPRKHFDEKELNDLAESIRQHGVIQPLIVRRLGEKYEIIAGERRYKASGLAGLEKVPVIIKEMDDKESAEVALIENVQRQNLTAIEEAESYNKLINLSGLTQEQVGNKVGVTQGTIANKLRLLNLTPEVKEALLNKRISERHARSLLKVSEAEKQNELLRKVIAEKMPVRLLDQLINGGPKMNENTVVPTMEQAVPSAPVIEPKTEEAIAVPEIAPIEIPDLSIPEIPEMPQPEPINHPTPVVEVESSIMESTPVPPVMEPVETPVQVSEEPVEIPTIEIPVIEPVIEEESTDEGEGETLVQMPPLEPTPILNNMNIPTAEVSSMPSVPAAPNIFEPAPEATIVEQPEPVAQNKFVQVPETEAEEIKTNIQSIINEFKQKSGIVAEEPEKEVEATPIVEPSITKDAFAAAESIKQAIDEKIKEGYKIVVEDFDFKKSFQMIVKIEKE